MQHHACLRRTLAEICAYDCGALVSDGKSMSALPCSCSVLKLVGSSVVGRGRAVRLGRLAPSVDAADASACRGDGPGGRLVLGWALAFPRGFVGSRTLARLKTHCETTCSLLKWEQALAGVSMGMRRVPY